MNFLFATTVPVTAGSEVAVKVEHQPTKGYSIIGVLRLTDRFKGVRYKRKINALADTFKASQPLSWMERLSVTNDTVWRFQAEDFSTPTGDGGNGRIKVWKMATTICRGTHV